jgi:cytochrome bd-type quinol oxidase subunit 1
VADLARPVADVARPLADVARPVADVARPLADVARPVAEVARPVADVARPVADMARPVADMARPVADMARPVADMARPGERRVRARSSHRESRRRSASAFIVGQPNVAERRLENPIVVPELLSFLAYGSFGATVKGLDDVPRDQWPDSVELLYFSYHIMVGLGTLLLALMGVAAILLWRGVLHRTKAVLWMLMLAFPFPYIATTAGWMTAELGRQPWVVYGILRTARATSPRVGAGDVAFSTLGYAGLYALLSVLFLYLVTREIARGPTQAPA